MTFDEAPNRLPPPGDATVQDPGDDVARLDQAISHLRNAMIEAGDERFIAAATKCSEILRGLLAAVKDQKPEWSLEWQADWVDSQLEAIASTLRDVASQIRESQFGPEFLEDHGEYIDRRYGELTSTALEACTDICEAELPDAMAFRRTRRDAEAETGDLSDEIVSPPSRRMREKIKALHGGQLVMILVAATLATSLLAAGAIVTWLNAVNSLFPVACFLGAGSASSFAVWALWVWFGSRRLHARSTLP